ncbi:MAG TPA: hypothetical protein VFG50_08735 [Rhodothermales bacterium]|nr:hypothetical protein [Rhodothermales bacterium]
MKEADLREEVDINLEQMQVVVDELVKLQNEVSGRDPTLVEKVAAGAFLMQFYTGAENVLKRISKHNGIPLPDGERWHAELLRRFCLPPRAGLPGLFDGELAKEFEEFRSFRHIVRSGYGTDLNWALMARGIDRVPAAFEQFRTAVLNYLNTLE